MSKTMATLRGRRNLRGFTLIELMIVVVIVGILAAIAYPSYQEQVRKSRRADGKAMLMDVSQRLERCYTRFAAYDNAGCGVAFPVPSLEEFYTISGNVARTTFTLSAAPQGPQADDAKCGTLTYTNAGVQGSNGDPDDCW